MPAATVLAFILICCRVHADVIIKDEPATFAAVASDQNGNQVPVVGNVHTIEIFDIYPADEAAGNPGLKIDINVSPLNESDVSQNASTARSIPATSAQQSPILTMGNAADGPSELVSQSTQQPSNAQLASFPPARTPASGQTLLAGWPGSIPNQFGLPSAPSTNTEQIPSSAFTPISLPGGQLNSPMPPLPFQPTNATDYGSSYGSSLAEPGIDYSNSSSEVQSFTNDTINATNSGVNGGNWSTQSAGENPPDFSTTSPYGDAAAGKNISTFYPFPTDNNQPTSLLNPQPQLDNADQLSPFSNARNRNTPTQFLGQSIAQNAFSLPYPQSNTPPPFNQRSQYFRKPIANRRLLAPRLGGKPTRTSGPKPDDVFYPEYDDSSDNDKSSGKSKETKTAPWYLPFLAVLEDLFGPDDDDASAETDATDYYDLPPANDTAADRANGDDEIDPIIWYEYFHPEKWNSFTNLTDFDRPSKRQMGPNFLPNAIGAWSTFKTAPNFAKQWLNFSALGRAPTTEYASFSISQFGDHPSTWSFNTTEPEFVRVFEQSSPFNVADLLRNASVLQPWLFLTEAPSASSYNAGDDDSQTLESDDPSPGTDIAALVDDVRKIINKLGAPAERPAFDFNPISSIASSNVTDLFPPQNNDRDGPETSGRVGLGARPRQPKTTNVDTDYYWYQSVYPADESNENVTSEWPAYSNSGSEPNAEQAEAIDSGVASSGARIVVRSSWTLTISLTAGIVGRVAFGRWM